MSDKHTTLDQLTMLAQRSKTEIDKVDGKVDALTSRVDGIATIGGEPNVITAVKVNGDALPVADKAVDVGASIAAAVAAADHLQRTIVTSVDDIDLTADDAEKFIYMVPRTDSDENDQYDEYMVLDGAVERVGSTRVNLSDYVRKDEVATDAEITAMLNEVFGPAEETEPVEP